MFQSVSARFGVPFLLFLLPIVFVLVFLVSTHDKGIATASNEISGLPSIDAALDPGGAVLRAFGRGEAIEAGAATGADTAMAAVQGAARAAETIFGREAASRSGSDHAQSLLQQGRSIAFQLQHHAGSGHAHVDLDPDRLKLLQGIVSMARALGNRTIAEGAERSAEVAVLASLECDLVQGFVTSRPLVAAKAMIRASELEEAALRQITEAA